jgi:hypothetical protein
MPCARLTVVGCADCGGKYQRRASVFVGHSSGVDRVLCHSKNGVLTMESARSAKDVIVEPIRPMR